jgi:hypothetical protein
VTPQRGSAAQWKAPVPISELFTALYRETRVMMSRNEGYLPRAGRLCRHCLHNSAGTLCRLRKRSCRPRLLERPGGIVTGEVERLLLALEGPMSRVQIQEALSLWHEDHFRAKYLIPAPQGPPQGFRRFSASMLQNSAPCSMARRGRCGCGAVGRTGAQERSVDSPAAGMQRQDCVLFG